MRALAMPGMGSALAHSKTGSYVVGWGEPASSAGSGETSNALVWVNRVMRDLGPMGGMFARAFDVNANGLVVGQVGNCVPVACRGDPFVWINGEKTSLPKIDGGTWAGATAINRTGTSSVSARRTSVAGISRAVTSTRCSGDATSQNSRQLLSMD